MWSLYSKMPLVIINQMCALTDDAIVIVKLL